MQACQVGQTGNRIQGTPTFTPAPYQTLGTPVLPPTPTQAHGTPTFLPAPTLAQVTHTSETMARVVATAPNPRIPEFPGIFTLLMAEANTTPQVGLERLTTLPLGERPPLVVCLEAPETHIRMLWGTNFVTPSFYQPTPKDGKVLALA